MLVFLVPLAGCHLPIGAETDPRQKKSVHRVWSGTPALALADTCDNTCDIINNKTNNNSASNRPSFMRFYAAVLSGEMRTGDSEAEREGID